MSTENQAQENKMGVMPENRLLLTMAIPIVISMLVTMWWTASLWHS